MHRRLRSALLVSALALVAACTSTKGPATLPVVSDGTPAAVLMDAISAPVTPIGGAPGSTTPTASGTAETADRSGVNAGSLALVERAIEIVFLDPTTASVVPLDSATLLTAAFDRAAQARRVPGAPSAPSAPPFTGDPRADLELFRPAYLALLAGVDPAVDRADLARAAIRALVDRANMPWVANNYTCNLDYLAPAQVASTRATGGGVELYVGVGIWYTQVGQDWVAGRLINGAAAERAGLRVGDVLLAVDGASISGLSLESWPKSPNGAPGTSLTLTIRRPGEVASRDVTLTRVVFGVPPVVARVIETPDRRRVGYLWPYSIGVNNASEVQRALESFEAQGVTAWILDLRDLGEWNSAAVPMVAGRFIAGGTTVGYRLGRGGRRTTWATRPGDYFTPRHPLAVLTGSGRTAWTSEVLAGSLQELGVARVFGQQTLGCVIGGNYHALPDGSALRTMESHLLTAQGRNVHGVGLPPDEVVAPDPTWVTDPTLDAALAWLATQP